MEEIWIDISIGNIEYLEGSTIRHAKYKKTVNMQSEDIITLLKKRETIDALQRLVRMGIMGMLKENDYKNR